MIRACYPATGLVNMRMSFLLSFLLVDRGFLSRRMLFEFAARDIPFVVRMIAGTTTDFAEVAAFMASGKADAEIDFT